MNINIVEVLNKEIEKYHLGIIINVLQDILRKVEEGVNETERLMIFSRELLVCQYIWSDSGTDYSIYDNLAELYERVLECIRNN